MLEPWQRQPAPPPVIPPYDPVLPATGGSWTTPPGVNLPPGIRLDGAPISEPAPRAREPEPLAEWQELEPEPELQSEQGAGILWQQPQQTQTQTQTHPHEESPTRVTFTSVAEVLDVRDSIDRVLDAIHSFEEDVTLLSDLEVAEGGGGHDKQLEQLRVVSDVLRADHNLETLQAVVDKCWQAAQAIMHEVEQSSQAQVNHGVAAPMEGNRLQAGAIVPATVDALRDFLKQPRSEGAYFCRLRRSKQKERTFQLYVETSADGTRRNEGVNDTETLLVMSATKRGKTDSLKANYPIKMELAAAGDAAKSSARESRDTTTIPEALFLGKVRTLQLGKTYSLFDAGKNAQGSSTQHRQRLTAVQKGYSQPTSDERVTAAAVAEFEGDRAELATVRSARKAGSATLEVLIAIGDTIFRPPSKIMRKQHQPQDSTTSPEQGGSSMTGNTVVVNGSTFVSSKRSVRADGGKYKPPPMHKSVLHSLWPDITTMPGNGGSGNGTASDEGTGTMYMQSASCEAGHLPALEARGEQKEFKGSSRNLVLKNTEGGATQLQLAKIADNEWLLDFWAPVTPLQAFGIALVAFEHTSYRH